MSDDFGTVNVKRGDRAREIEVMRERYRAHGDALQRMAADAPTDHLATEYQRLAREVETALAKLDELEGRSTNSGSTPLPPPPPRPRTSAGDRPLAGPPADLRDEPSIGGEPPTAARPSAGSRVAIILVAAVIVLAGIVWLIWHGSERRGAGTPVVEQTSTVDTAAPSTAPPITPIAQTAPEASDTLKITPTLADYGMIRKGTRAVRQFEVVNNSSRPVIIQVARSACHCLFYEYQSKTRTPPKGKETLTVTIDGAKAKAGPLRETLAVTAKEDPTIAGEITVQAMIK
jgi:hypothetical protein